MALLDAVVIGAGPNGLAAAIELARSGRSVVVFEAAPEPGGAARTEALTLPGFLHDVGATALPLAAASPFFRSLDLEGITWRHPEVPVAHPLDGGRGAAAFRSIADTAAALGADGDAYQDLLERLVTAWSDIERHLLGPLVRLDGDLRKWAALSLLSVEPATSFARHRFSTDAARALLAGNAAHGIVPLEFPATTGYGLLLLALAHHWGWPFAEGGSGRFIDALVDHLLTLGATLVVGRRVDDLSLLPPSRTVFFDTTPSFAARLIGSELPRHLRSQIGRFRPGPGAFKIDWALSGPIPWEFEPARSAGTVHVGGTLEDIAVAEREVWRGGHPDRPFMLLTQPTVADPARAPEGRHVAWAYTHVPNGSTLDRTAAIESQVERFAPGFRDLIIDRHTMRTQDLEAWNPNLVGGDVTGGANTLPQLIARPTLSTYRLGGGYYLCSASTPPGGGVHGMCGFHAARAALERELR